MQDHGRDAGEDEAMGERAPLARCLSEGQGLPLEAAHGIVELFRVLPLKREPEPWWGGSLTTIIPLPRTSSSGCSIGASGIISPVHISPFTRGNFEGSSSGACSTSPTQMVSTRTASSLCGFSSSIPNTRASYGPHSNSYKLLGTRSSARGFDTPLSAAAPLGIVVVPAGAPAHSQLDMLRPKGSAGGKKRHGGVATGAAAGSAAHSTPRARGRWRAGTSLLREPRVTPISSPYSRVGGSDSLCDGTDLRTRTLPRNVSGLRRDASSRLMRRASRRALHRSPGSWCPSSADASWGSLRRGPSGGQMLSSVVLQVDISTCESTTSSPRFEVQRLHSSGEDSSAESRCSSSSPVVVNDLASLPGCADTTAPSRMVQRCQSSVQVPFTASFIGSSSAFSITVESPQSAPGKSPQLNASRCSSLRGCAPSCPTFSTSAGNRGECPSQWKRAVRVIEQWWLRIKHEQAAKWHAVQQPQQVGRHFFARQYRSLSTPFPLTGVSQNVESAASRWAASTRPQVVISGERARTRTICEIGRTSAAENILRATAEAAPVPSQRQHRGSHAPTIDWSCFLLSQAVAGDATADREAETVAEIGKGRARSSVQMEATSPVLREPVAGVHPMPLNALEPSKRPRSIVSPSLCYSHELPVVLKEEDESTGASYRSRLQSQEWTVASSEPWKMRQACGEGQKTNAALPVEAQPMHCTSLISPPPAAAAAAAATATLATYRRASHVGMAGLTTDRSRGMPSVNCMPPPPAQGPALHPWLCEAAVAEELRHSNRSRNVPLCAEGDHGYNTGTVERTGPQRMSISQSSTATRCGWAFGRSLPALNFPKRSLHSSVRLSEEQPSGPIASHSFGRSSLRNDASESRQYVPSNTEATRWIRGGSQSASTHSQLSRLGEMDPGPQGPGMRNTAAVRERIRSTLSYVSSVLFKDDAPLATGDSAAMRGVPRMP